MKRSSIFLILAFLCGGLSAQQRSLEEVNRIANQYFETRGNSPGMTRSAKELELIASSEIIDEADKQEAFYLCNHGQEGFVLVSADAQMPEVLGYSSSYYEADKPLPDGLLALMRDYAREAQHASLLGAPMSAQAEVAPLVKTAWDQLEPFNGMCPRDGSNRSMTGCVATVAAQVMKYYEWPEKKGKGKINYVTDSRGIVIKIDLADYNLAWNMMLDVYEQNKYSTAQASAVARLMYAIGAASLMDYSSKESAALVTDCMTAMCNHFDYDQDMCWLLGDFMSAESWNELIVNELNSARPVMFSGRSDDQKTGHSFILDGYRQEGSGIKYHVNWGWGGYANGYYLIYKLSPEQDGASANMGSFNVAQSMVLNCKPDDGKSDPLYGTVGDATVSQEYFEPGTSLSFSMQFKNIFCCLTKEFSGEVCANLTDEKGVVQKDLKLGKITIPHLQLLNIDNEQTLPSMPEGRYTLRPYLLTDDGRRVDLLSQKSWPVLQVGGTGIDTFSAEKTDVQNIYDLQGRRKKNAGKQSLPAGFYIFNGEKVVIR